MDRVGQDPLVIKNLLKATDPQSGLTVTLAPPPHMTEFLKAAGQELPFPPRFGEHNGEIYGEVLGIDPDRLQEMKGKGII
jgi:formyl-CoA transferase